MSDKSIKVTPQAYAIAKRMKKKYKLPIRNIAEFAFVLYERKVIADIQKGFLYESGSC